MRPPENSDQWVRKIRSTGKVSTANSSHRDILLAFFRLRSFSPRSLPLFPLPSQLLPNPQMNALDLEQSAPLRRRPVRAAGSENGGAAAPQIPHGPPGLPARHPLNIFKRTAIIGGTLYAMHGAYLSNDVTYGIAFAYNSARTMADTTSIISHAKTLTSSITSYTTQKSATNRSRSDWH
jgi:hypothetical protein